MEGLAGNIHPKAVFFYYDTLRSFCLNAFSQNNLLVILSKREIIIQNQSTGYSQIGGAQTEI